MTYFAAISSCLKHYFNFSGRAPRSEYCYWSLTVLLINILLGSGPIFNGKSSASLIVTPIPLLGLFWLLTVLPNLSVMVRRLHDVGKSGWWWMASAVPFINFYLLYLLFFKRGTDGPNTYGDDPRGANMRTPSELLSTRDPAQTVTPFTDEELARLLPQRGSVEPEAGNIPRPLRVSGQAATGFGRRGVGDNPGFRGFQTTQQRLARR